MAAGVVDSLVWLDQGLPFRRRNGALDYLVPTAITDRHAADPVVAVETGHSFVDRGVEFLLINLLQLATPPANDAEWAEHYQTPPDPDRLARWLNPLRCALDLIHPEFPMLQVRGTADDAGKPKAAATGSGFDDEAGEQAVDTLLPDRPTNNVVAKRVDVFHKRQRRPEVLSAAVTGAALYAHIVLFPPGGGGYFGLPHGSASLKFALVADTLWRSLWLNVLNHADPALEAETWCRSPLRQDGRTAPVGGTTFAWLNPRLAKLSGARKTREPVMAGQIHRAGIPMQRRYRLDSPHQGRCDLTGVEGQVFASYRRWPGGLDYGKSGWRPLVVATRSDKQGKTIFLNGSDGPLRFDDLLDVPISGGTTPEGAWQHPPLAALGGRVAELDLADPREASTVSPGARMSVSLRATALGGEKVAVSLSERVLPLYRLDKGTGEATLGELRRVGMFMEEVGAALKQAVRYVLPEKIDQKHARKLAGQMSDALAARLDAEAAVLVERLARRAATAKAEGGEAADPAVQFRGTAREACLALFDGTFPVSDAGTVSARIARARRFLRDRLDREAGGPKRRQSRRK